MDGSEDAVSLMTDDGGLSSCQRAERRTRMPSRDALDRLDDLEGQFRQVEIAFVVNAGRLDGQFDRIAFAY
jgi:hypothetical protein